MSFVFLLSGVALTLLLSLRPMPVVYYAVEIVLCSLVWGYVAFRYHIIEKALASCKRIDIILSVLLAVAFIPTHYQTLDKLIAIFLERDIQVPGALASYFAFFMSHKALVLTPLLAFAAFSLGFVFLYASGRLRPKIIAFFKGLGKHEKIFLIAGSAVFAVATVILFNQSNIYYVAEREDTGPILWDIVYTTAPGAAIEKNCYANPASPENDLRQALFGIFAMPFGLSAQFVSFLIPSAKAYPICINIVQIILLFITLILLSRMLEVGKSTQLFFLLISVAAFPFILFSFVMEQYIFALFWTVLLIYNSFVTRKTNDLLSVAAVGSITTSVVLIPFLLAINKEFSQIFKKGWKMILIFVALFICGGIIEVVYKLGLLITNYVSFLSEYGFMDKVVQFSNFVVSCIVAPCSRVIQYSGHIAYHLCAPDSLNPVGVVIFALAVLSGALFIRKYIAQVSLYWVGFAFALIAVLGWGTAENGTVLYSLYIYWAFIVLLTLLLDKMLSRVQYLMYVVYGALVAEVLVYNILGMWEIVRFGIINYPAL